MRCTRQLEGANDPNQPCDRCRRNNRACRIPLKQPLGRKPGALGRYRGVEKAVRQIQTHVRKAARESSGRGSITPSQSSDNDILGLLLALSPRSPEIQGEGLNVPPSGISYSPPACTTMDAPPQDSNAQCSHRTDNSVSNPLGLMADASGEAQKNEEDDRCQPPAAAALQNASSEHVSITSWTHQSSRITGITQDQSLLCRPGYVSLGLKLDRSILEHALADLSTRSGHLGQYANYFKSPNQSRARDIGPDLDPIDLGLIGLDEVGSLFTL